MKTVVPTGRFRKDLKLAKRRNLNLNKLAVAIDLLIADAPLPSQYRDHNLTGQFRGCRECHLSPDWLLIYQSNSKEVHLIRTGSHADLFE